MKCEDVQPRLTAYLDGELSADSNGDGSAVRGHLRGCAACRAIAGDEAVLRDGLRALPPLDPPASMWAGVQQRLAAAEVADAERPAWRRALARWVPLAPRFGFAGLALAAALVLLVWRSSHDGTDVIVTPPTPPIASETPMPAPAPAPTATAIVGDDVDVTIALAALPARESADYASAAADLLLIAQESRGRWSDDRKRVFDAKIVALRHDIDSANEGRPRQKAYRAMIRYLQGAAIRDEVAANDRGTMAGTRGVQ